MLTVDLIKEEKKIMPVVKRIDNLNISKKKIFFVLSLGRSGHHAVINWICEQSRPSCYFNNCNIVDGIVETSEFYNYVHTIEKVRGKKIDVGNVETNLCLINIINISLEDLYKKLEKSDINVIIILRDCYNWVASRIKYGGGVCNKIPMFAPVWKELVKTCLYKNEKADTNLIDINFNKWFLSKKYRKQIAEKLGIKFTDRGLNFVEHMGKSVFEDTEKGQELDVLNRWKDISSVKLKDRLDKEMIDLTEEYFGMKVRV